MDKEEQDCEREVKSVLSESIQFHSFYDQFLFHPEDVPIDIEQLPEVFTVFRKKCEKYSKVRTCFLPQNQWKRIIYLRQVFLYPV